MADRSNPLSERKTPVKKKTPRSVRASRNAKGGPPPLPEDSDAQGKPKSQLPRKRPRKRIKPSEQVPEESGYQLEAVEGPEQNVAARNVPGWVVSGGVHAVALIILGLYTLKAPQPERNLAILSSVEENGEELEEIVVEELVELEEIDVESELSDRPDAGVINVGDVAVATEVSSEMGVGHVEVNMTGEIGALFGDEGLGMSTSGMGTGGATFFGVQTKGNKFVFVVDNSNSMGGGKFETAVNELMKSISALGPKQRFYVIFYSDTAYPLFYPDSAERLVFATEENKRRVGYWLSGVHRCLQTRGSEAMQGAFQLDPDVIYLLGDGSFTDGTVKEVLSRESRYGTIHTLGFGMNDKARKGFQQIAEKYRGKFTEVKVTPAMVALSKKMKRPKNNTRNGVWGIKLGGKKKKKK